MIVAVGMAAFVELLCQELVLIFQVMLILIVKFDSHILMKMIGVGMLQLTPYP
ncbi:MAG: hypothetical protein ACI9DK_000178 [Vicingaceae bacterium]|jgi:hypothetical protein